MPAPTAVAETQAALSELDGMVADSKRSAAAAGSATAETWVQAKADAEQKLQRAESRVSQVDGQIETLRAAARRRYPRILLNTRAAAVGIWIGRFIHLHV